MTNFPPQATGPHEMVERARQAAEQGDYATAAALYQRGVGNPDPQLHVAALLGLADARYRLDDEQGALQAWITATMAPETPLAWRAWVALAGARVREGDLTGAARCYREAEARAPFEEKPAIQSRLGWLNKEMGNQGAAKRYFGRARVGAFTPLVTYAIIAITVVVSLLETTRIGGVPLLSVLELNKHSVMGGEYWRLLTVALVHSPQILIFHLGMNMFILYQLGPLAEALYGRALFLATYLVAALGASIASYLLLPSTSVGASGAVFGIAGLVFASTFFHKSMLRSQARAITRQIGFFIVINLAIGFGLGGLSIDNYAHLGGLLVGAWLGFLIEPRGAGTLRQIFRRDETSTEARHSNLLPVLGVVLLGAVLVGGLLLRPFWA